MKSLIICHFCISEKKKAMFLLLQPIGGLFLSLHENMVHIFWVTATKPQAVLWFALDLDDWQNSLKNKCYLFSCA